MANIYLTHRAIKDLKKVQSFSKKEWGKKIADSYIENIQNSLNLLESNPKLLISNPQISSYFKLYQVKSHWLVCHVVKNDIYILTVKHISMNLLERLKILQPTLESEAKILASRLKNK